MELSSDIEIYDSDIPALEAVLRKLNEKVGTRRNAEYFRQEIIGRFHEIGFMVDAKAFMPVDDGEKFVEFRLSITGRCERKAFDHERQAHEVQHDVLGLGDGGVITEQGAIRPPI